MGLEQDGVQLHTGGCDLRTLETRTWQHHVGLKQDGVQLHVVLVKQPEDVAVDALRPVRRRLDGVVACRAKSGRGCQTRRS